MSAALSAIMITGALVLSEVILGTIDDTQAGQSMYT
jgi:hypothetical protein